MARKSHWRSQSAHFLQSAKATSQMLIEDTALGIAISAWYKRARKACAS